ncbi:TetR family transcriptional regulator [Micromonospora sp. 15K316]|uniref:TetR/AcrR family transcriptional regulator n=1 Tax=Micromonospora sp. 15K316 TaxID=2530376 RepID=UPI00104617FF|nr:TetR/AcrR family transcriptional regulator [Micromonospora sp. 15K316]TDC38484.1 TetR family transcriptional regulator [Micromonospora sp. 15K316]
MPSITRRPSGGADRRLPVEARILATTEHLLAEGESFTELGVQRIAREAGVARSTFYMHFADKTQLLLRLAESFTAASFGIAGEWQPAETGRPAGGAAGLETLVAGFREIIAVYRRHSGVLAAINEVSGYEPAVRRFWRERLEQFLARTVQVLEEEQRAARAPRDVDIPAASRLIVIGGERFLADHVATDDGSGDEAAARELANTWWYGVYRRPAGQEPPVD